MKTKKIISAAAASALLVSASAFSVIVSNAAASSMGLTITSSISDLTVGDKFTVSVNAESNPGITAYAFGLNFDNDKVKVVSVSDSSDEANATVGDNILGDSAPVFSQSTPANSSGYIKVNSVAALDTVVTDTGTMFTVEFEAITEGAATFDITRWETLNDSSDVNYTVDPLVVNIEAADDTEDTADTADTEDTADTPDTADTADTPDTEDTADTNDTEDTADTADTNDTEDTDDTEDTSDTDDTDDIDDGKGGNVATGIAVAVVPALIAAGALIIARKKK